MNRHIYLRKEVIISFFLLFFVSSPLYSGWFYDSIVTGGGVRVRSFPSEKGKVIGFANKGCKLNLSYIKGSWGRIYTFDHNFGIFARVLKYPFIGWMHIKYIDYLGLRFFGNKTLSENMTLKKEYEEKFLAILKTIKTGNDQAVINIFRNYQFGHIIPSEHAGYAILLSNLRDEYVKALVNLLTSENEELIKMLTRHLLNTSIRELVYEEIEKNWSQISRNAAFRLNALDFLHQLSERRGYPVDFNKFLEPPK